MDIYKIKEINYKNAGDACRMWLGDINGDGIMEIVMVQPDGGFDDRFYPHSVQCATAFDLDGNMLWQIGEPDPEVHGSGSDIPAQIYDIDRDGNNEFICAMNDELCIFDGKTGELKEKHGLPDKDAHDCIIIADLEGTGYAQNIIVKNRYRKLWALDRNYEVMWTFEGDVGHYPWVYDLNRDGCDEVIAGYTVLDASGKPMWRIDMEDHADCIWVGDLMQNGQPLVMVGGADTTAYTADGRLVWRFTDTVESQNIAPGKFILGKRGLQIAGLDRIVRVGDNGKDGIFLFDCNANPLYKEDRKSIGWSTIVTVMHGFTRSAQDYILAYRRGGGLTGGVYDGEMNCLLELPYDGHCMWADLTGDGLSQLLLYNGEKITIYSTEQTDLLKPAINSPRPQPKRLYNWTRYWGSEIEPERYAVGYVTGDFENCDIKKWAQSCNNDENITIADFAALLVNALGLKAYYTENFKDVLSCDYFVKAAGIIKALGIIEGDTLEPDSYVSIEDANAMLDKAGAKKRIDGDGFVTMNMAARVFE